MHIMEGFLPLEWCIFWTLLTVPVLAWGAYKVRRLFREEPDKKLMVAVAGAFMFVLSSLKLPSVGGSSSHPTGAGVSTVLYGVGITSLLSAIVLLFQALLLAHGGLTTLGANVFSMGIAGPFAAFLVYRALSRARVRIGIAVFAAAFVADLMTYMVTAGQLALAFPSGTGVLGSFEVFMTLFAVTQVPLAVVEGVMTAMFFGFLARSRPELLEGPLASGKGRMGRKAATVLAAVMVICMVGAVALVNLTGISGADERGVEAIQQLAPDFAPWADNLLHPDGATEIALFALQAFIGIAVIMYAYVRWKRSRALVEGEGSADVHDR